MVGCWLNPGRLQSEVPICYENPGVVRRTIPRFLWWSLREITFVNACWDAAEVDRLPNGRPRESGFPANKRYLRSYGDFPKNLPNLAD
jgi:hypothetical protein